MRRRQFVTSSGVLFTTLAVASRDDGQLRARAARDGAVRVIVTLAIPGPKPPPEDAIRDAQERLIGALRGTRYADLRRFRKIGRASCRDSGAVSPSGWCLSRR